MTPASTEPLREMGISDISWWPVLKADNYHEGGKIIILPPSCAGCLETWESHLPGTLMARLGLYRDCLSQSKVKQHYYIHDGARRNIGHPSNFHVP